jgi:hypothetical protein
VSQRGERGLEVVVVGMHADVQAWRDLTASSMYARSSAPYGQLKIDDGTVFSRAI